MQSAGGVGGLILTEEISGTTTTAYHFHYDGNGNVTEITDLSGNSAARYRYDAFGNTLVATGSYAASNKYRFSTKSFDSEVPNGSLYYYGYRYYNPTSGRWPSRDFIEERGGVNLYGFIGNNPHNYVDYRGLSCIGDTLSLLENPAKFFQSKAMSQLTGKVPVAKLASLAAELGKAMAEAAESSLKNVEEILKKKNFTTAQLCCINQHLENEHQKSITELDANNTDDKVHLLDAMVDCCIKDPGAVMFSLIGNVGAGIVEAGKNFVVDTVVDSAFGKVEDKLKDLIGTIDGVDQNALVKDAMEYAAEQAAEVLKNNTACAIEGGCNKK